MTNQASPLSPKETAAISTHNEEAPVISMNNQEPVISTGAQRSGETRFSTSTSSQAQPPTGPSFFMRWLTYLVLLPLIALATAGFGCISLLAGLWDKSGSQQQYRYAGNNYSFHIFFHNNNIIILL